MAADKCITLVTLVHLHYFGLLMVLRWEIGPLSLIGQCNTTMVRVTSSNMHATHSNIIDPTSVLQQCLNM